jgi:hypothetical protein
VLNKPQIEKETVMKNQLHRIAALVAFTLFAICAAGTPAVAQNAYGGTFTLPQEVKWQGNTLVAGTYSFTVASTAVPARIMVKGPTGSTIILTSTTSQDRSDGPSVMTLQRRHGALYVQDLFLHELDMHLRFAAPKRDKARELAQGPVETQQILMASLTK